MPPFSQQTPVMTIEGLGKKFREARRARNLTLDEAARMTKIRPARLAEIEADDFSQFPSLAYAKGFLLIYGKFLDVDVTPYLDAFEDSERVTVDGYSYLQENPPPKPVSTPVVRHARHSNRERISPMPLIFGILVLVIGFGVMKLILNLQRLAPRRAEPTAQVSPAGASAPGPTTPPPAATAETPPRKIVSAPTIAPSVSPMPTVAPTATVASAIRAASGEPEVRRAKPVGPGDLAKAQGETNSSPAESGALNRVAIRPLKRTYIKVTVNDESQKPALERWISPGDGTVEFRAKHVSIRVLDRDAVEIKKNGKELEEDDEDVTVE
jgi:cytoskeletal protein RodZ